VSAFHGGADLVANIKSKNRRRSSSPGNDDEAERKKLQVSLETGESQIGFRYAADMNKFGDIVRIGDGLSHPHTSEVRTSSDICTQPSHASAYFTSL
jgi:hypothetical protein